MRSFWPYFLNRSSLNPPFRVTRRGVGFSLISPSTVPDENYARENLQLHTIGLLKLNKDGTPVLDRFGKTIKNYEPRHIATAAKIWTGIDRSFRRGE